MAQNLEPLCGTGFCLPNLCEAAWSSFRESDSLFIERNKLHQDQIG